MPGEFYTYSNANQAYAAASNGAAYTSLAQPYYGQTYYTTSYGAYNTAYIDPLTSMNRGYRRFDSNNNSTDESIHLIQRRKSANGTSTTSAKEKSYSLSRERLEKNKSRELVIEATSNAQSQQALAAKPLSPSRVEASAATATTTQQTEKVQKSSSSKKEKKSSSKTNDTSNKSKSKRRDKREIYAEEYYIADQQHFASFDPLYPTQQQPQFIGEFVGADSYPQATYYDQSYQQQIVCPGGPPLVPNQYAPIGDSLMHNSIAYVHDAIVEPIVTVGPRTDLHENGFFVTDANGNVPGAPAPMQQQVIYQTVVQAPQQYHQYEYQMQQQQQQQHEMQLQQQQSSFYPSSQQQQLVEYSANGDGSLPPGSKLVAEYILGYLEESSSQNGASNGELVQVTSSTNGKHHTKDEKVVIEMWEKSRKSSSKSSKKQSHQSSQQQKHETDTMAQSETFANNFTGNEAAQESSTANQQVNSQRQSKKDSYTSNASSHHHKTEARHDASSANMNDFKSEIIQTIKNEIQNFKLNADKLSAEGEIAGTAPIQPIFLMPQQNQEQIAQKPIYVPRNVYIPVIRPVFVPRERIIVRPQIVHVARPVLVDRPVPVTQKPIIIERDRAAPIRAETLDTELAVENQHHQVDDEHQVEYTQKTPQQSTQEQTQAYEEAIHTVESMEQQIERVIVSEEQNETLNYEYAPIDYQKLLNDAVAHVEEQAAASQATNAYAYQDLVDYDEARKKHEITQLLDEVERKKLAQATSTSSSSNAPYTLEVYDSTVSDKFEKVDQASLKNLYGIEPYQYLTQSESAHYTTSADIVVEKQATPRSSISNLNNNNNNQKMVQNFASPYIVDQK